MDEEFKADEPLNPAILAKNMNDMDDNEEIEEEQEDDKKMEL